MSAMFGGHRPPLQPNEDTAHHSIPTGSPKVGKAGALLDWRGQRVSEEWPSRKGCECHILM